jgi:hypothetical protein
MKLLLGFDEANITYLYTTFDQLKGLHRHEILLAFANE